MTRVNTSSRPVEALQQRHDVDAAGFQYRATAQRNLVQLELRDALRDRGVPRQEARAHPIGGGAEPQVEARGLDLIGRKVARGHNPTRARERRDHPVGQDSSVGQMMILILEFFAWGCFSYFFSGSLLTIPRRIVRNGWSA
jgi:hypothetical protein